MHFELLNFTIYKGRQLARCTQEIMNERVRPALTSHIEMKSKLMKNFFEHNLLRDKIDDIN